MIVLAGTGHAYSVSGLVEFSYRDYETKVGGQKTSWSEFVQNYRVSAETFVFDPRILFVRGGIGYSIASRSGGDKSNSLSYDLSTEFFRSMKYSFTLDAVRATSTVSPVGAPEYDITSTSYGGKVVLDLNRAGRNGNNNNNNTNNDNFRRTSFHLPLPQIILEQRHTEVESTSSLTPQDETRDETKGYLNYQLTPNMKLNMDSGQEKYKNLRLGQSYDTKWANLQGMWQVTQKSDLNINGRLYEREVQNISGFVPKEKTTTFGLSYNVQEIDKIAQGYQYNYSKLENATARSESQSGGAKIWYRLNETLRLFAGLNYGQSDYVQFATFTTAQQEYHVKTGDADLGAAYSKVYAPDFLRPFLFHVDYDFSSGFSSVSSSQAATGSGNFYGNNFGAGILSNGWTNENLTLDYRYSSRRDNSPAANDTSSQSVGASLSTRRVPKTIIGLNASYSTSEANSNLPNNFAAVVANSKQKRHQFQYAATADYTPTDYLAFSGGATRNRSISQMQTLSTLGVPQNVTSDYTVLYGMGTLNYNFTRQLDYHLQVRHDHLITQYAITERSDTDELKTWLNYRIRMVTLSLEYRIREYSAGTAPKSTQQTIFTKLSRPF